jgi:O-antigen ligase
VNVVLALLLIGTPLAFGTVEPWSIAIMEMTAFGLFLRHWLSRGLALPTRRPDRAVLALFLLLAGLVLVQLAPLPSAALALLSPAALGIWRTFAGDPPGVLRTLSLSPDATRQELFKVLAYAAVFVVVVRETRTRSRLRSLVTLVVLIGGSLGLLAVAQKLAWNGRIFWIFPVSEAKRSGLGIWGPYINHNHFAGYLEMAIPLGLGLLFSLTGDSGGPTGDPWRRRFGRFVAGETFAPATGVFLLVLLMSACLVASRSRGGIIAWAASLLFFAWITLRRRSPRRKALAPLLATAAIVAAVLAPSWERIAQRFDDLEQYNQVGRLDLLENSLAIVKDFPLFGTGLGTFGQAYRSYQTTKPALFFDHAHNDYMEIATDTGVAGLLLAAGMAVIFTAALVRGLSARRGRFAAGIGGGGLASCFAIAVHSGTDFNLRIPANALLFAVVAALTYAAIIGIPERPLRETAPAPASPPLALARRPLRWFGPAAAACLALALPARDLLADYHFRQVERLLDDTGTPELDVLPIEPGTIPSYRRAAAALERASALAPARAVFPQALAELYSRLAAWAKTMESLQAPLGDGALGSAEALRRGMTAARRAISLEPTDPQLHLALGQLLAAADGDLERGAAQIRLALKAHPVNAPLRQTAAMVFLRFGNNADALAQARELARIDDSYLVSDSALKKLQSDRRAPAYLAQLQGSYLFQALEIAWRATADIRVVKSLAPLNADAQAVLERYLEWRGVEE